MSTVLWILQAILSIKLVSVAFTHGVRHDQTTMRQAIERMGSIARPLHIAVAVVTPIGAIALVTPAAIPMPVWATPLTAAVLAVLMLCSIAFHVRSREQPIIIADIVLAAIAAVVAYGRWFIAPL